MASYRRPITIIREYVPNQQRMEYALEILLVGLGILDGPVRTPRPFTPPPPRRRRSRARAAKGGAA